MGQGREGVGWSGRRHAVREMGAAGRRAKVARSIYPRTSERTSEET